MTHRQNMLRIVLALAVLLLPAYLALPQTTTASILGIVRDASGAAVPGASVAAVNIATNISRAVSSAGDGSYSILFLPIGSYRIEINATGFKKFERSGITLEVGTNAQIEARLEVGGVSETVQVTADAPMVETTTPVLGPFNKTTQAANSYLGTSGRNIIDGPGMKNFDMTIARMFKITEGIRLQFRAEATNAFNLVNLSNPGTNANSSSTYGKITTARPMRQMQLGLKLIF
jgi:hypothetical protein